MPLCKDLGFVHKESGLPIELHWRLFLNPHANPRLRSRLASRVVPVTGATGLRTMGEEDLFAYLCRRRSTGGTGSNVAFRCQVAS
jgi:hypothetical protein